MPEPRTLVFGAAGSLGRHVMDGLVARGTAPETITAVGRNTARLAELAETGFTTPALDLADAAGVADLVSGHSDIGSGVVLISGSVSLDEDIATGTFSRVGDDLTRLIGRPTTGLVEALTDGARS